MKRQINCHTSKAYHNTAVRKAALFLLIFCIPVCLFGCGPLGEEDTPDMTLEYLSGEYATQLVHDGAEQLLGSVELTQNENGDLDMILHPKELIQDSSQPNGWRVDSFALNRTFVVPEQAYVTYCAPGESAAEILTPADFCTALTKEYEEAGVPFEDYGDTRLYDVYALDNQVLLILYHPL